MQADLGRERRLKGLSLPSENAWDEFCEESSKGFFGEIDF